MASTRNKNQQIYKIRKTVQELFKNEMGLLVDKVKPGGRGTPNDENIDRSSLFYFLNIIENLIELLVSTKTLFADFM